jgi:biopolymer transport protein ExbD
MLDMTFQLLFFFLVWFHPSNLEGQLDLTLPTDKPSVSKDNSPPVDVTPGPDADKLDEPPEVTVIVRATKGDTAETSGQISEVSVQVQGVPTIIHGEGGELKDLMAALRDHLKKLRPTLGNKNDVMIKAERQLRWRYVVNVRDAAQKAGFSNAHFSPPPDH